MSNSIPESDAERMAIVQAEASDGDELKVLEGPPGCAGGQILGRREEQQDCFGWKEVEGQGQGAVDQMLLALADGMGGHRGGAVASRLAVEAFCDAFRSGEPAISEFLEDGLERANEWMATATRKDPYLDDMGTTLVGAHIAHGRSLRWISVGDSPMWRLTEGQLVRLNKDHSMKPVLPQLVEMGVLTEEDAAKDSRAHQLRSAVMGDEIPLKDLQDEAVTLADDDVLIIASDGLETLDEAAIAEAVESNWGSATAIVEALLTAVQQAGKPRQDNATVIVYSPELAELAAAPVDDPSSPQAE